MGNLQTFRLAIPFSSWDSSVGLIYAPPPIPMPISTRQKTITPTREIPGELEARAWARVAKMMMMSSRPYIFLRPTMSARIPKPSCPRTVPPDVATLMAVSALVGMAPPFFLPWK